MTTPSPQPVLSSTDTYPYPPHHSFPPFYTLQPNQATLTRQLHLWSHLILSHCSHTHTFLLSISSASTSPLFNNHKISRALSGPDIKKVLDYMTTPEGEHRAEWLSKDHSAAWIWWKSASEWAELIAKWVEETGQKGVVLTIYELRESEAVERQEWVGMDEEMLRRCLDVLVKKGRAQVFGQADGSGVKFF
ncbi:ESCRT-II complex component [Aureobasidium sp. EXF-10727]|nr:ESCRT-II complex component [Aureobasidium sp. EXF-10727]